MPSNPRTRWTEEVDEDGEDGDGEDRDAEGDGEADGCGEEYGMYVTVAVKLPDVLPTLEAVPDTWHDKSLDVKSPPDKPILNGVLNSPPPVQVCVCPAALHVTVIMAFTSMDGPGAVAPMYNASTFAALPVRVHFVPAPPVAVQLTSGTVLPARAVVVRATMAPVASMMTAATATTTRRVRKVTKDF
jgi:hypothetical protein